MARISTHVLDIERGCPASGIAVELHRNGVILGSGKTNADGRTDAPIVSADRLVPGPYELIFHTADYLKSRGSEPFFDEITIRFAVSDESGNYHVPLLLAAHGYTTYRGS